MLYQDIKLEKRLLPDDHPLAESSNRITMLPEFKPDDKLSYYENLKIMQVYDLRKKSLKEIYKIKSDFYRISGEIL